MTLILTLKSTKGILQFIIQCLCIIYGGENKTKERKNIMFVLLYFLQMKCILCWEYVCALFHTKLWNKKKVIRHK